MTGWIVHTLVSSSLLMLAVLAVRAPAARIFGARAAYALWLLPALRMVLPTLPGWRTLYAPVMLLVPGHVRIGITDPAHAGVAIIVPAVEIGRSSAPALPVITDVAPSLAGWQPLLCALWLAGAALWFGWQMLRYRRFLRRALRGADLLSRDSGTEILVSTSVDGPLAAGIVRRRIFLPADFLVRYTSDERRLALLHEGAHHDRGDILANFVGLGVVALHWWNPLARFAYRAFRADQELACDATVLAGADARDRHAYGSAIVKSAVPATPTAACALNHKTQIKRRLGMLMTSRPISRARLALGGIAAATAIVGGLLLTATGSMAAAPPLPAIVPAAPVAPIAPVASIAPVAPAARREAVRHAEPIYRIAHDGVRHDAAEAAEEARAAADAGRQAAMVARYITHADARAAARASLASARAAMTARCMADGTAVSADADWRTLAMCGTRMRETIRASLAQARMSLSQAHASIAMYDLTNVQRAEAIAAIDRAIANLDRKLAQPVTN